MESAGHSFQDIAIEVGAGLGFSLKKKKNYVFIYLAVLGLSCGFPGGSAGKESACNVGDPGLIPEWGRSPRGGHSNPLQYSCLENLMDRVAWRATVHGVAKSRTRLKRLSVHTRS